jgi:hypothetical protein
MEVEILRLISVVEHGVGGPETGAINLIYSFLLRKYKLDFYSYIRINQIGEDLQEFVMKEGGKKIHINIRYPASEDYELKTVTERDLIRLDIIHKALLRLSANDSRIQVEKLENIKNEILQNEFLFDIQYKEWKYKKDEKLSAKIIIRAYEDRFDFFVLIEEDKKEKYRLLIYQGKTTDFYIDALFFYGKWKNINEFMITGKNKEVEIHIYIQESKMQYVNLTGYEKAPFFEMMKANITKQDASHAYEDWLHSLPPAHAAIIRKADN